MCKMMDTGWFKKRVANEELPSEWQMDRERVGRTEGIYTPPVQSFGLKNPRSRIFA